MDSKTMFILAMKGLKNRMLKLIVMIAMAMALSLAVAFFVTQFLEEDALQLEIALVNLDTSHEMDLFLNTVLKTDEIQQRFDIQIADTREDGERLVRENEVYACVVLPENLLYSIMVGYNDAPEVLLNESATLEQSIMYTMVESLSAVIRSTQSGIYATIDELRSENQFDESMILQINIDYFRILLEMLEEFDSQGLPYTKVLTMQDHYFIYLFLYLMLLSTVLFYRELSGVQDLVVMKYIATMKWNYQLLYYMRIVILVTIYFLIFMGAMYLRGAQFDQMYVLSLLNASFFFIFIQSVLFQCMKNYLVAVQLNCMMHTAFLFVVGGIIPSLFLPKLIAGLEVFAPSHYIANLMATGFVYVEKAEFYHVMILSSNCLMCITLYLLNRRKIKQEMRGAQ